MQNSQKFLFAENASHEIKKRLKNAESAAHRSCDLSEENLKRRSSYFVQTKKPAFSLSVKYFFSFISFSITDRTLSST